MGRSEAPKVRVVTYTEQDLKPGDIFEDAEGDVWIARSTVGSNPRAMLIRSDGSRADGKHFALRDDTIPEPYDLLYSLEGGDNR